MAPTAPFTHSIPENHKTWLKLEEEIARSDMYVYLWDKKINHESIALTALKQSCIAIK